MNEQRPPSPLSDLSFFRFPELTPDVVRDIILWLVVLAVTVILTAVVQYWLLQRAARRRERHTVAHRLARLPADPELAGVWQRLLVLSGAADEQALLADPEAFETAVDAFVDEAQPAQLDALQRLRQRLHLNVMNPEQRLVSTRQLLKDLPVRLLLGVGGEKLDLYCAVLDRDERQLVLDTPPDADVFSLLAADADAWLLYWREQEGETAFRVRPEPVGEGQLALVRVPHALRDAAAAQRADFRLTADVPVKYAYLTREALVARRRGEAEAPAHKGEGRLLDISHGGASVRVAEPLPLHGFARIGFALHGQVLQVMLEVLDVRPEGDGYLVRGRFRGQGAEVHHKLDQLLTQEQLRRLRHREHLHVRTDADEAPPHTGEAPGPAPAG